MPPKDAPVVEAKTQDLTLNDMMMYLARGEATKLVEAVWTENKFCTFLGHSGCTKTEGGIVPPGERPEAQLKPNSSDTEKAAAAAFNIGKPQRDEGGWDAVHFAIFYRRPETLKFLIMKCGMDCNSVDANGYTALHRIAYSGNMECAHLVCAWIHEKVEDKKDPEVGRLAVAQLLGYRERREENGGHVHTGKILGARDNRSKRTALERAQLNSHHELIDYWQHKFLHDPDGEDDD